LSTIPDSIAPILAALRTLPVWILVGLAVAGWIVLFSPSFTDIDLASFRHQWGVWVWIEAIAFSALSIARLTEAGIQGYRSHKVTVAERRVLSFVPLHQQSWWNLAKQQDDGLLTQFSMDVQVTNVSEHPVKIVKVELLRPKTELLHAAISLPVAGTPYHSSEYPVPDGATGRASIHIMARGALACQGRPLGVTIRLTDHFGTTYTLPRVSIKSVNPVGEKLSIRQRLRLLTSHLSRQHEIDGSKAVTMPWLYDSQSDGIELTIAILKEEQRSYAAKGRSVGGLGSLNCGLHSEPNFGATAPNQVPPLLWEAGKGSPVTSPNLDRLLQLHASLDNTAKANLESYLLAQLSKDSQFANIGYFVFLCLHRLDRTVDAIITAKQFLAGDRVSGYSNVLATLSAVISREHDYFSPKLFKTILESLAGSEEYDFKLREKLNLAQLQALDRQRALVGNVNAVASAKRS
jgi:hypothetical protein